MAAPQTSLPARLIWLGVAAMALDIGVSRISYGMLLVPLRADLQLSYTVAGLLSSLNLAAYLAGNLIAPQLAKRWSMPALACGGHAAVALGALLNGLAQEVFVLAAGRLLMGLGAGVGLVAVFVIAFSQTPIASRGAASAAMWSGIGLALIGTAASLPFTLDGGGAWRWVFLLAAVVGASVAFGLRPGRIAPATGAPTAAPAHHGTLVQKWWHWLPLFGAYGSFGLGYIAYTTFVGVRLANLHLPVAAITASWAVMGLATLAGCWLTAKLLGHGSLKRLAFALSFVTAAIGCLLVSGEGALLASAAGVFVGLGLASTPAILTAYVRERTSDADYPRLFSIGTTFLGAGQLAGPAIAGALTDRFGSLAVIYLAFAAYALGGLLAALDIVLARKHWR